MRRASIAIACVGCGASGVDIHVTAPPGVEQVELFVAPYPCKPGDNAPTCDRGVAWDDGGGKREGSIFILDVDESTAGILADDGSFRFTLHTDGGAADTIKRMVFVGYGDAAGAQPVAAAWLTNVALPTGSAEEWRITLDAVEPVPTTTAPPAGDTHRLHVWTRERASSSRCVVGEYWHEGMVEREFLVPPGDTDCDDIDEAKECDPYWWQTPGARPPLADASCVTNLHPTEELPTPVCLLGGPACSEVGATTQACIPVTPTHCASKAMCSETCRTSLKSCVQSMSIATVKCRIPTDDLGRPCADAATLSMDFQALVSGSQNTCLPPSFSSVVPPPAFASPATIDGVTLTVQGDPSACMADVEWTGLHGIGAVFGLVAVPFNNDTASVLGLLLEFEPAACADVAPSCTTYLPQLDDVFACGRALAVK